MATLIASVATIFAAGAVGLSIASLAAVLKQPYGNRHRRYGRSIRGDSAALERTMALIRQEDVTGCGMRLVCELGALPARHRGGHEDAILELVGRVPPGSDLRAAGETALGQYRLSRALGEGGGDCARAFPLCPFNGTQLMQTVSGYVP
ncbi:uncharacterized protein LOC119579916 [Penaeus monodon]|uniref:uncharacterized protein LOC119579916 n=1 Tax=Penaeus monodon TaxID=6687 RepID=UPI0018A735C0|nr:uncharacterized protein LOC119579916 [Penaeus monodon]